jgi:hypothetical protein
MRSKELQYFYNSIKIATHLTREYLISLTPEQLNQEIEKGAFKDKGSFIDLFDEPFDFEEDPEAKEVVQGILNFLANLEFPLKVTRVLEYQLSGQEKLDWNSIENEFGSHLGIYWSPESISMFSMGEGGEFRNLGRSYSSSSLIQLRLRATINDENSIDWLETIAEIIPEETAWQVVLFKGASIHLDSIEIYTYDDSDKYQGKPYLLKEIEVNMEAQA